MGGEITLGNVLSGVAVLLGVLASHMTNANRLQAIETKVDIVFRWFESEVIRKAARDATHEGLILK